MLASFDSVGSLATVDEEKLQDLLAGLEFESPAIIQMLDELVGAAKEEDGSAEGDADESDEGESESIPEKWQILVDCETESCQREWLEKLSELGLKVRSLIS